MSDIMDKWNAAFDKQPHVIIELLDNELIDYISTSDIGVEVIEDTSELRLRKLLTEFFPDWKHAEWDYDAEWNGYQLVVTLKNLDVDDIGIRDGDPEEGGSHPIYKRIDSGEIDVIWLAKEGIYEATNEG